MRRWCWLALGGLVLVVVGAPVAFLMTGGVSARPEPSGLETRVARRLRSLAMPASARLARNPLRPSPELLSQALAHFADHCAVCHGADGSGSTPLGRGLSPRVPDLRGAASQELTDGELFFIIENGVRLTGMPAFGGAGRPEESWKLVHFIRHLPDLTAEELAEVRRLEPRGPGEWRELQEDEDFLRGEPARAGGGHDPHGGAHGGT